MKILLVEDSQIQIDWAKKELQGHELTIVTSAEEYYKAQGSFESQITFDLVITDLVLPDGDGSKQKAHWRAGWCIFRRELEQYLAGARRGVALVSNFEHHMDSCEDMGEVRNLTEGTSLLGIRPKDYYSDLQFDKKPGSANVVVFVDLLCWRNFPNALLDGQVICPGKHEYEKMAAAKERGAFTLLKPYKQIVEALS